MQCTTPTLDAESRNCRRHVQTIPSKACKVTRKGEDQSTILLIRDRDFVNFAQPTLSASFVYVG
jgi:hypothetical protein